MTSDRKTVRLSWELGEVAAALEAVAILAASLAHGQLGSERAQQDALPGISATLSMVVARLHLVCRVLRGEANPKGLWARTNDAPANLLNGEHDVLLNEWSTAEIRMKAEEALRRVEAQLERAGHRRRRRRR